MRERERFLKSMFERSAKGMGHDNRVKRITVAQRKHVESLATAIMRGRVTYGERA